jgi:hypothetical protein
MGVSGLVNRTVACAVNAAQSIVPDAQLKKIYCVGKRQPKLIEHDAGKSCVGSRCTNVAISGKNRDHEISKIR